MTFTFKREDGRKVYYFVYCRYQYAPNVYSMDYIILKELPVPLKYMIYYIRECLLVYYKPGNTEINYIALKPPKDISVFNA